MTICAWIFADSAGTGTDDILVMAEGFNSIEFAVGTSTILFQAKWSTAPSGAAGWNRAKVSDAWVALAVSYDAGSVSNDPVCRIDFAPVTLDEFAAPSGTFTQPATGYCVGNRTAQSNGFIGMLRHVQVFNRILSSTEMDDALRTPGSVTSGQKLWLPMANATDLADQSGNGFNGTGSDLATGSSDPPIGTGNQRMLMMGVG